MSLLASKADGHIMLCLYIWPEFQVIEIQRGAGEGHQFSIKDKLPIAIDPTTREGLMLREENLSELHAAARCHLKEFECEVDGERVALELILPECSNIVSHNMTANPCPEEPTHWGHFSFAEEINCLGLPEEMHALVRRGKMRMSCQSAWKGLQSLRSAEA